MHAGFKPKLVSPKLVLRLLYRHGVRYLLWLGGAVALIFGVALVGMIYWLPGVGAYKGEIEQRLSAAIHHPVRIGSVHAHWDGLYPGVRLQDVALLPAPNAEPALRLRDASVSIAWLPLLWGEVRVHRLTLERPDLTLVRLADGSLQMPGFAPFAPTAQGDGRVLRWLFIQERLSVVAARLTWEDRLAGEAPLTIANLNVDLHNGSATRHRAEIEAQLPATMCTRCALTVDLNGDPLRRETWDGQAHVRIQDLVLQNLPAIVRERLPLAARGTVSMQLRSQWRDGKPFALTGPINIGALEIPDNTWSKALTVAHSAAQIAWSGHGEGWNLYLTKSVVGTRREPWVSGNIRVARDRALTILHAEYVDIDALMAVAARLQRAEKLRETLAELQPRGRLRNLKGRVKGAWSAPDDYEIEAQVQGAALKPFRRFPGFSGLSGQLNFTPRGGRFDLKSYTGVLSLPVVFAAPLDVSAGSARVRWQQKDDHWAIAAREIAVRNRDGRASGEVELRVPFDRSRAPWIRLSAQAPQLNGKDAERYYPINLLSDGVRAWLSSLIVGGTLNEASVELEGDLKRFPFKDGGGKFLVQGRIANGKIAYLRDWPAIEGASGQLEFRGSELTVRGQGHVGALSVQDLVTHIPDLRAPDGAVAQISGTIRGPVNETLNVLRAAPNQKWQRYLPTDLRASGDGELAMTVSIPVRDVKGFALGLDYRFARAGLQLPAANLRADDLRGQLRFSEKGLVGGQAAGRVLGGDTTLTLATTPAPNAQLRLDARGRITRAGVEQGFGNRWAALINGHADWTATAQWGEDGFSINGGSDLQHLALNLPTPLNKPVGTPLRLVVKGGTRAGPRPLIDVTLGGLAAARVALERHADGWQLQRARVHLGEGFPNLPADSGMHLSVLWPHTDGDQWLALLRPPVPTPTKGAVASPPVTAGTYNDLFPTPLTRVSLDIAALELFQRPLGRVAFDLTKSLSGWQGFVRGNTASGSVGVSGYAHNRTWQLNLEHLVVPPRRQTTASASSEDRIPRDLPTVYLQSKAFQFGNWQLGRTALWGAPIPQGWRVHHLVFSRPEMNAFIKGDWTMRPLAPNVASPETPMGEKTDLEIDFKTDDLGMTLGALAVPDQIKRGKATLQGRIGWDGPPTSFSVGRARGSFNIAAQKGQFLRLRQGAGKLLGLFDINSIARYVSLDFSSVFGRGYVFDTIGGSIDLDKGNAVTRGLTIEGPSADVRIVGRAGIVSEDFDMELAITPHLRGSLAVVGGLAGGPVGLGTALLLERVLKKQIAEGTLLVYTVQGEWANPVVRRVIKEPIEAEANPIN